MTTTQTIRATEFALLVLLGIAGIALYLVILASAPIATSCHGYITAHRPDGVWNYYCEDRGP